jgi:hypothetical protein
MDKDTRNAIERATQRARLLLEEDFASQLEGTFDVLRTGAVPQRGGEHLSARQQFVRDRILAAIEHKKNAGMVSAEAVADYLRDAAFTALNRFVALKMLEARELVQECVTKGEQSAGYKEFCGLAPGVALLPDSAGYRLYVESLFDELSTEVKVLFDRRDPASVLWPRRQTFDELLAVFNGAELAGVWGEDETIGWVYQFFNSGEERRAMRDASQAPRNSRELAVRNQFFTPRYVVEFLTDNTLGRIWYEMRRGETKLASRCAYMVRSPNEVFCGTIDSDDVKTASAWLEGRDVPAPGVSSLAHVVNAYERRGGFGDGGNDWVEVTLERLSREGVEAFSTQELLDLLFMFCRKERFCEGTLDALSSEVRLIMACVGARVERARAGDTAARVQCVLAREAKDPRDLRVLDPACGSGHFLLYAFDLLVDIYEEAWAGCVHTERVSPPSHSTGRTLRDDYGDAASLRRAIPTLILRHNLHGVDIDPRCAQIAQLALWLRAQRAFRDCGVARTERPIIRRANVVVAEPMPCDAAMVAIFAQTLDPPVLGELFTKTVSEMRLAGELGLLLRIDVELATAITAARKQFVARDKELARGYLPGFVPAPKQGALDLSGVDDQRFFEEAEARIGDALRRFVGSAAGGAGARRRLFADDAAHGLGLVELSEKKFDVVLMNPPFGEATATSMPYLTAHFADTRLDLFAAFASRCLELSAPGGLLGAITPRDGFFKKTLVGWRHLVLRHGLSAVADLGIGVLDSATVRVAAYVIERVSSMRPTNFFDLVDVPNRAGRLRDAVAAGTAERVRLETFSALPLARFLYWLPDRMQQIYSSADSLENRACTARYGLTTHDDERFCRLFFEVDPAHVGRELTWTFMSKGGDEFPYGGVSNSVVRMEGDSAEMLEVNRGSNGMTAQARRASSYYFRPALAYPNRSVQFSVRWQPADYAFSMRGVAIIPLEASHSYLLGFFNSRLIRALVEMQTASQTYTSGVIKELRWVEPDARTKHAVEVAATAAFVEVRRRLATVETDPFFTGLINDASATPQTTDEYVEWRDRFAESLNETLATLQATIDEKIAGLYGVCARDIERCERADDDELGVASFPPQFRFPLDHGAALASYAFGVAVGRYDVQLTASVPALGDAAARSLRERAIRSTDALVLVDDPGHVHDLGPLIEKALARILKNESENGLSGLERLLPRRAREWFAREFFTSHIAAYSALGRTAPIYWQVATPSARYSAWLYLHALTGDTLYALQRDYVAPKLAHEERQLESMRADYAASATVAARRGVEAQEAFVEELRVLLVEIVRVAPLWVPHLNDGVVINAAPLWRLFPNNKDWQKELKATWQRLCEGQYDWSQMAMRLWPERVVLGCAEDRSLAIAHGLDEALWVEDADGKWTKREHPAKPVAEIVKARTSPAVKEALKSLIDAPVGTAPRARATGKRGARAAKGGEA